MIIQHMQCEHMENPMAVDAVRPLLGFSLAQGKAGAKVERCRILVATDSALLKQGQGDCWDSGWNDGGDLLNIHYAGSPLESRKTYYWMVQVVAGGEEVVSPVAFFGMGLMQFSQWKGAGFIGLNPQFTPKWEEVGEKAGCALPFFRKAFQVAKPVRRAKAFATALGVYELSFNGCRAGDYEMAPLWTNYHKSLQYQGYDLTDKVRLGENVIGAVVGDGWFAGNIACVGRQQYGDAPLGLMVQVYLEYEDGTIQTIGTDGTWKGATGPFVYTDNQTGEYYDANKELGNWCAPGYDDSDWHPVEKAAHPLVNGMRLKASIGPQAKVCLTLSPKSVRFDQNGRVVVDMGQNMVGRLRVKVKGQKGQKLVFHHGEMLWDDGTLYTGNLRSALQEDIYVCKGSPEGEWYEPHFTFHGFRYVEVQGLDYLPEKEDVVGKVIYSACQQTGFIETGNAMVNQLFSNQLWGQRGNFLGVPTDCPQRDERMGWTGDAQVFARSACYNMDCAGFYDKYLEDMAESQKPNGAITDVVPSVKWPVRLEAAGAESRWYPDASGPYPAGWDLVGNGNAAWGDAAFVIPYTLYETYGDKQLLEKYYPMMSRYMDYLYQSTEHFLRPDFGYGDWLSVGEETPKDLLSTAFFAYDALLMEQMALALERHHDAAGYATLYRDIRAAFRAAYLEPDGKLKGDTQCCYLLAVKMKLVQPEEEQRTVEHLIRTIARRDYHLSTGFVGVSYLLPILCDYGRSDIAYRLLLNDTYPSWGYSIKNGATTIWERWNSYTKESGFGDEGMNSFNHYSLGSVAEWMYRYMGGIQPLEPGYRNIQIKPYMDQRLGCAKVCYRSASGEIACAWEYGDGKYVVTVQVPANTAAVFALPQAKQLEGVAAKKGEKGFLLEPGYYRFAIEA